MVLFLDPYIVQKNLWIAVNIPGVTSHVLQSEVKASGIWRSSLIPQNIFFTFSKKGTHVISPSDDMEAN